MGAIFCIQCRMVQANFALHISVTTKALTYAKESLCVYTTWKRKECIKRIRSCQTKKIQREG